MRWEEEAVERKKLLKNICEYNYIIDHPSPATAGSQLNTIQPNAVATFLPKLQTAKPAEYTLMKKNVGPSGASATSPGPFYKKRGQALSQLE